MSDPQATAMSGARATVASTSLEFLTRGAPPARLVLTPHTAWGRRGGGDGRGNVPVLRIPARAPAGAESPPQGCSGPRGATASETAAISVGYTSAVPGDEPVPAFVLSLGAYLDNRRTRDRNDVQLAGALSARL